MPSDSGRKEAAAVLVAADKHTDNEIASQVGVNVRTLARWKNEPAFRDRVAEHVEALRQAVLSRGIADRVRRIERQQADWERMQRLIAARATDMREVPGGDTGLLARDVKSVGSGENATTVEIYRFDAALVKELRELEKHTAQELGQWTEKHDVNIPIKAIAEVTLDDL